MEFCCGPAWWGSWSISFHQKLKEHVRAAKFIKNKNDQWNHAGEMGPWWFAATLEVVLRSFWGRSEVVLRSFWSGYELDVSGYIQENDLW